jgi:hypothetical protein
MFHHAPQRAEADLNQALPDEWPYQVPGAPRAENLRRLAIHYLHSFDSQVDSVQMELRSVTQSRVVIVLAIHNFLQERVPYHPYL